MSWITKSNFLWLLKKKRWLFNPANYSRTKEIISAEQKEADGKSSPNSLTDNRKAGPFTGILFADERVAKATITVHEQQG